MWISWTCNVEISKKLLHYFWYDLKIFMGN